MGDAFRKVRTGDPLRIPAETFNSLIDVARAARSGAHDQSQDANPGGLRSDVVLVKNNTAQDCSRFRVMCISGSVIDPAQQLDRFKNQVVLVADGPGTLEKWSNRVAISLEPIPAGKIGRGCVGGICPAQVNVTDETHLHVRQYGSGTFPLLASDRTGFGTILWKQAGTGNKWAVIWLNGYTFSGLNRQIFTQSGSFTVPHHLLWVHAIGAGGGGAAPSADVDSVVIGDHAAVLYRGGGGGGAGGSEVFASVAALSGDVLTVTIGVGGTNGMSVGSAGQSGGNTTVVHAADANKLNLVAAGGGGASSGSYSQGGAGGAPGSSSAFGSWLIPPGFVIRHGERGDRGFDGGLKYPGQGGKGGSTTLGGAKMFGDNGFAESYGMGSMGGLGTHPFYGDPKGTDGVVIISW